MQKIILDTNVIVSALLAASAPRDILFHTVLARQADICISDSVFEEYEDVLRREKFASYRGFALQAEIVLDKIERIGLLYIPERKVELLTDLSDNKFLELAAISKADFIITGNRLDFNLTEFEGTRIVSPTEYWEKHQPN
jgi:uncharacterized protein